MKQKNSSLFESAKQDFLQGRPKEAQRAFRKLAITKDPLILLWYTYIFLRNEKFSDAQIQCELAISMIEKNQLNHHLRYVAYFIYGNILVSIGKYNKAKTLYATALQYFLKNGSLSTTTDLVDLQKKSLAYRIDKDSEFFVNAPKVPDDNLYAGHLYMLIDRYVSAVGKYSEALKEIDSGKEVPISKTDLNYYRGICLFRRSKPNLAVAFFDQIPISNPLYASARIYRARALVEIEGGEGEALAELDMILNKERCYSGEVYFALGQVFQHLKRYHDAVQAYEAALQADPLLDIAQLKLAEVYMCNHEYEKAIEPLNQYIAVTYRDDDGEKFVYRATCFDHVERTKEAQEDANKAAQRNVKDTRLLSFIRARVAFKLEQWSEAIIHFDKFLSLSTQVGDSVWREVATCYENMKNYDAAEACRKCAYNIDPKSTINVLALAKLYILKAGETTNDTIKSVEYYNVAIRYIDEALALDAKNAEAYYLKGKLLFEFDRLLLAYQNFIKAQAFNCDFPELEEYLQEIQYLLETAINVEKSTKTKKTQLLVKATEDCMSTIYELEVANASLSNLTDELKIEVKILNKKAEKLTSELINANIEVNQKEKELSWSRNEIDTILTSKFSLQKKFNVLQEKTNKLEEELAISRRREKKAEKQLAHQQETTSHLNKQLNEAKSTIKAQADIIKELQEKLATNSMKSVSTIAVQTDPEKIEKSRAASLSEQNSEKYSFVRSTVEKQINSNSNNEVAIPLNPSLLARAVFTESKQKQKLWPLRIEIKEFMKRFVKKGYNVFLVGGGIRSLNPNDFDFIVDCPKEKLLDIDPNFVELKDKPGVYQTNFQTGNSIFKIDVDLCPAEVFTQPLILKKDAKKRNITITAIYVDYWGKIYDPFNGLLDLLSEPQQIVRFIDHTREAIAANPVNLLRALNLVAEENRKLEEATEAAVKNNIGLLKKIDNGLLDAEIRKIFFRGYASSALATFYSLGFMENIFPDVFINLQKSSESMYLWLGAKMNYVDSMVKRKQKISIDYVYLSFLACELFNLINSHPQADKTQLANELLQKYDRVVFHEKRNTVRYLIDLTIELAQFMLTPANWRTSGGQQGKGGFWDKTQGPEKFTDESSSALQHQT